MQVSSGRGSGSDGNELTHVPRQSDPLYCATVGPNNATTQGVPQGGPLSPLLANIMLDPLGKDADYALRATPMTS